MKRIWTLSALSVLLSVASPSSSDADILVLKDGNIIEGKITKLYQKKIPGQGGPKNFVVIQLEDNSEKEYQEKTQYSYFVRKKPSWVVREENKKWYADKSPAVKETWQDQEKFAKDCRRREYLERETTAHFKKAYELRKPEIKETIEAHIQIAKMLDEDYELYEEGKAEWRWVYDKKLEGVTKAQQHVDLADWCIDQGLYDESYAEFNKALELEPNFGAAKKGLNWLLNSPRVNSQFFRALYSRLGLSLSFLLSKQKPDGAIGSDVTEASIYGKHGMTALSGLALLAYWDFQALKRPSALQNPPKPLLAVLQFTLTNNELGKGIPNGVEVWGPIYRLEFLAQCAKRPYFADKRKRIEQRAQELLNDLKTKLLPDGGWYYYDNEVNSGGHSSSFVTSSAIVALMDAKEAGLPFDDDMVKKACEAVAAQQVSPGLYSYFPGGGESEVGCAGRSSLCEYALIRAGHKSMETNDLVTSVENFFKNRHLLEAIKGAEGTHIGEGQTAPYYYLFGHYWTTRALKLLPKDRHGEFLNKMKDAFIRGQEPNGKLFDTPLTKDGAVYGTAFGSMWAYEIAVEIWKAQKTESEEGTNPGSESSEPEKAPETDDKGTPTGAKE